MIRYTLLWGVVFFLALYAQRDWFKSLCGLIVLVAVLERPDMPSAMLGIPGINPWNVLMLFILVGWISQRQSEGLRWDMPKRISRLLLFYALVLIISFIRVAIDRGLMDEFALRIGSQAPATSEILLSYVLNAIKFTIPGLLLYDGCRSDDRARWAMGAIAIAGVLLAVQVIRWMPIASLLDATVMQQRAVRVLDREIGLHRVDLSTVLAGMTLALYCAKEMFRSTFPKLLCVGLSAVCGIGMILTAGRAGYLACAVIGLIIAVFRYRFLLVAGPVALALAIAFIPAVQDRILEGFTEETHETSTAGLGLDTVDESGRDLYAISSGRVVVWPIVLDEISKKPLFGFGGQGMLTSGAATNVLDLLGAPWGHPHNAYLEWVLDNGVVGLIPVLMLYWIVMMLSIKLFLKPTSSLVFVIGAGSLAMNGTHLVASIGSQSFYPKAGSVYAWCMIGLLLRAVREYDQGFVSAEVNASRFTGTRDQSLVSRIT